MNGWSWISEREDIFLFATTDADRLWSELDLLPRRNNYLEAQAHNPPPSSVKVSKAWNFMVTHQGLESMELYGHTSNTLPGSHD